MPTATIAGIELEVDEEGFILEPEKWTPEIGEEISKEVGCWPMTEEHWKVVHALRDYYKDYGMVPPLRQISKVTGFEMKRLYELFPYGPGKGPAKIGGLTKPAGCV
ncbi:MAG: TusE/DsrC/DsvC family sulfur relay protein [Chloroflexi bacterium]|nr:TusE/DsrC/DsvC family sulfur relay protein [Chloroflexota bacterium]